MAFQKAEEIKKQNLHLIGQKFKGATIDEIIIRPTNQKDFDEFTRIYLRSMNSENSIIPFKNLDLQVDVVCEKAKIRTNNVFFRTEIENLLVEGLDVKL